MKCPRCGRPAYVGFSDVKCTNTECVHFDQREADDFAARKTLPPKSRGCTCTVPAGRPHTTGCPYFPHNAAPPPLPCGLCGDRGYSHIQCPRCGKKP